MELQKCSFCGKSDRQVGRLIAGPGVCICDECVSLCLGVLENDEREIERLGGPSEKARRTRPGSAQARMAIGQALKPDA